MFGVITDDETGWSRFAGRRFVRRSFRDAETDWIGPAISATVGIVTTVIGAATHSGQPVVGSQPTCPAGYVYNPNSGLCEQVAGSSNDFFSNISPTTLAIGAGVLALLVLGD